MGLDIFENERTSEKEYVEIEDWGFSVHFVLGFQENSIYTLHLCFSYDITKWCKVYTKADFWFQKSHERFEQLQTSSGKSKKLKFDELFPKKCISSAKTLYSEEFIQHFFQLLVWKLTKLLMSFLKPYLIFHDTTSLYLYSSDITYFLQK